jgi:hypothetical protein
MKFKKTLTINFFDLIIESYGLRLHQKFIFYYVIFYNIFAEKDLGLL